MDLAAGIDSDNPTTGNNIKKDDSLCNLGYSGTLRRLNTL
jgi:hypothetical protein